MLTIEELKQVEALGIPAALVNEQLARFRNGFPWLEIEAPATPEKGIKILSKEEADSAVEYYKNAKVDGKCKFVPASGAASRMFKDLFNGLEKVRAGESIEGTPAEKFVSQIDKFAFYDKDIYSSSDAEKVLSATLEEPGLGYGSKPKGVLKFHRYADGEIRTALAEHLVEAQKYMRNEDGSANLVITISPQHRELFEKALAEIKEQYEKRYDVKYDITFTYQSKATDTIAVDMDNKPFRNEDGSLLFRPAGHGALIFNLNQLDAELVSIKNIDNVASEKYLEVSAFWKQVLMGKALELRDKLHAYTTALNQATCAWMATYKPAPYLPGYNAIGYDNTYMSEEVQLLCNEIEEFFRTELCIELAPADDCKKRVDAIMKMLQRPVRVCGMVRNLGEAGGGPFIIREKDGSTSLQILEGAQINKDDAKAAKALSESSHFNPVDIVCCLKDVEGKSYNLLDFVDEETGFISFKSSHGKELKALELPGLWNGSMSKWNTLFVDVPVETFNPVKTVLDLLRPAHQA